MPRRAATDAAMKTPLTLLALVAAAALAGCDTAPETIEGGIADPNADAIANEVANVQLPPSIVASHKYRCGADVVAIDWLSDGTTNSARVTPPSGTGVTLSQAEAGGDYTADGATLKGSPQDATVTWNGASCKK